MVQSFTRAQYEEAAGAISQLSPIRPTIGLVLGSGLGSLADELQEPDIIPYSQIPHWPAPTVSGHAGRLLLGRLEGQAVVVLQGRMHFYEGFSVQQITLPVRVMRLLGATTLVVTNAAGGLNPSFQAGDLMLIRDHLNLPGMAGQNPLRGPNDESLGERFPDMTEPYDAGLRQLAHQVAGQEGFSLREGTYAFVGGPSYETKAELRLLQQVGADAVGMSTVPSVVVARHAGMKVLGISSITNMALPDRPAQATLSHAEVLATGQAIVPRLATLLRGVLRQL